MGFVGNYAPGGLSPQMDDIPVIPQKGHNPKFSYTLFLFIFSEASCGGH